MSGPTNNTSEVYARYFDELRTSLLKQEKNEAIIDDVLQEAFIKYHLNDIKGRRVINPKGWLYRVSKNILIDFYRAQNKRKLDATNEPNHELRGSHGPGDCLEGIIANLPAKYKEAVYLTDIKGRSQTESAKSLGVSVSTFKSQVQRGRKLITKGYIECCDYSIDENGLLKGMSKDWSECKVCSKNI